MTTHAPGKFIVPIPGIRLTTNVDKALMLGSLFTWHPDLAQLAPEQISHFDPEDEVEHGSGNEEESHLLFKPLYIVSKHDRLPPDWRHDAVFEHLRPVMTFTPPKIGKDAIGVLHIREFIVPGAKGHAHAPYGDDNRMEDVVFIPTAPQQMTDEQYKNRYRSFPRFDITK